MRVLLPLRRLPACTPPRRHRPLAPPLPSGLPPPTAAAAAVALAGVHSPLPPLPPQKTVYGEGTHFRVPWLQTPHTFDIRMQPRNIASTTGTKDLQVVTINLRVLSRPQVHGLPALPRRRPPPPTHLSTSPFP